MRNWVEGIRHWARAGSGERTGYRSGAGRRIRARHRAPGRSTRLEQHRIPVGRIAGVSAGAIVAAAYASGASVEEIADAARAMKFKDVARWGLSLLGLAGSERMAEFLKRLLKVYTFEEMRIPWRWWRRICGPDSRRCSAIAATCCCPFAPVARIPASSGRCVTRASTWWTAP
jgi:hypothetical protein